MTVQPWAEQVVAAIGARLGPRGARGPIAVKPVPGAAEAALLWALRDRMGGLVLWIGEHRASQEAMHRDLLCLRPDAGDSARFYPPWDSLPDGDEPPDTDVAAQRLAVLAWLSGGAATGVIVTCMQAVMQAVPSPAAFAAGSARLAPGHVWPLDAVAAELEAKGYRFAALVAARGQAAVRGGLLDLWPLDADWPVRVEWVGDAVESLRAFDPATQRSVARQAAVSLSPVTAPVPDGTLFDYLPPDASIVRSNPPELASRGERYAGAMTGGAADARLLSPAQVLTLAATRAGGCAVTVHDLAAAADADPLADVQALPDVFEGRTDSLQPDLLAAARERLVRDLAARAAAGARVTVALDSAGAVEHFRDAAAAILGADPAAVGIHGVAAPLSEGFASAALGVAIACHANVYGRRKREGLRYEPAGRRAPRDTGARLTDWTDLEPDDLVVHIAHGIGRYEGLNRITIDGRTQDVLTLRYADEARLHVPVAQAQVLSRYIGPHRGDVVLHRLGGRRWQRERTAAEAAVADLAASLLETQARRHVMQGVACGSDGPWQREFEAAFPFRETRDQETVIAAIHDDMTAAQPMDRLVCGDAGYGKTEVAMRAAFRAVMNGRQIAVLVPTTVLAQQHYETFRARMADYPVQIDMLSRFRSRGRRHDTLRGMAEGTVDIVIGTHTLLQDTIRFRDLGLVIVDEEQRFGVRHKEALKRLRHTVDVLTLTATPIPRTLYLSMTGARDLSLLQTPPLERVAIETIVARRDDALIRRAILRELNRKGQIYYLYNRVATIAAAAERLRALAPEARLDIAHGQMAAAELSEVMRRFADGAFDLLVCTTIIESGLDIPRANTILIDRADRFGMADLYQLRGRVGRSSRKAYAYLLLPPHGAVDRDARERLSALRRNSDLGAGFRLALRDLEIRGAGNLLGAAQSGHIAAVGFHLYCQMLRRTVARLKGEPPPRIVEAEVSIDFLERTADDAVGETMAGIPHRYIAAAGLRIEVFRRLAEAAAVPDIDTLRAELADRFGPPPPAVRRLLAVAALRVRCADRGIRRLEVRDGKVIAYRGADPVKHGARFPRLPGGNPDSRLTALAAMLEHL